MRRVLLAAVLLLAGCGIAPSAVAPAGPAPTGVAPGPTLYFVDAGGDLVAEVRHTGRLGTVGEALSLLLAGPGDDVDTGIAPAAVTRVEVTTAADVIGLRLPLATREVTPTGVDQIVCTALAAHVQAGGATSTVVRLTFTDRADDTPRRCPLIAG
jgi:hypothetical protein